VFFHVADVLIVAGDHINNPIEFQGRNMDFYNLIIMGTYVRVKYMMKNGVFWDVTPRGSCKNGHFAGT
jgi:hypothetical protein